MGRFIREFQEYIYLTTENYTEITQDGAIVNFLDRDDLAVDKRKIYYNGTWYNYKSPVFVAGTPTVQVNGTVATELTGSILDELAEAIRIKLVASDVILPTDKQAIYRPQAVIQTANLAGEASYTSPSYDGSQYRRITGKVFSDQSGTLNLQHSDDGTTWDTLTTVAVTGGTATKYDEPLYAKYVRLNYVNGATPQTAFRLSAYLSVE